MVSSDCLEGRQLFEVVWSHGCIGGEILYPTWSEMGSLWRYFRVGVIRSCFLCFVRI